MKGKLQGYTKNILKRSSFVHEANKLKKPTCSCPRHARNPLCMADVMNIFEIDISAVTIYLTLSRE